MSSPFIFSSSIYYNKELGNKKLDVCVFITNETKVKPPEEWKFEYIAKECDLLSYDGAPALIAWG